MVRAAEVLAAAVSTTAVVAGYESSAILISGVADLIVLVHAAFVVFVLLGGPLALRWPKILWFHAPAVIWGVVVEYAGFTCPLTPLEIALRERTGEAGYRGGFIEHYVEGLLYPTGLTRELQIALGTVALLVNVVIYWRVLAKHRAAKLV